MNISLQEIARLLKAQLVGEDLLIKGLAFLEEAQPGDLSFLESELFLEKAKRSQASALLVPPGLLLAGKSCLQVENPRLAFVKVLSLFHQEKAFPPGIHPTVILGQHCQIAPSATIMAYCVLGDKVVIEDQVILFPFVFLGDQVHIGRESVLFPQVTVYHNVRIGKRVRIHSNTVIGSDGFGYETTPEGLVKVPHLGTVEIGDEVEIGANCAIDRAKVGATRIGEGTKIDNLVQIGHNVKIGRHCLIAGQTGIAGSATLEDQVTLAGQVGVADHVTVRKGVVACGQAGIIGNIPPGEIVSGYPARPHSHQLRVLAAQNQLPELLKEFRQIRKKVEEIEKKIESFQHREDGE